MQVDNEWELDDETSDLQSTQTNLSEYKSGTQNHHFAVQRKATEKYTKGDTLKVLKNRMRSASKDLYTTYWLAFLWKTPKGHLTTKLINQMQSYGNNFEVFIIDGSLILFMTYIKYKFRQNLCQMLAFWLTLCQPSSFPRLVLVLQRHNKKQERIQTSTKRSEPSVLNWKHSWQTY